MQDIRALRTVEQLRAHTEAGAEPDYLFFWGHRTGKHGSLTKSCFSQWFEAPFTVDGMSYASAEHFMMAEKARLFDDLGTHALILAARTPAEAKALGRKTQGFNEQTWNDARFGIVVRANEAKFGQHPALREFLCGTGRHVLVEASPVDSIWGIGLAADHADASRPAHWPGLNLLGFAVMEVRSRLSP